MWSKKGSPVDTDTEPGAVEGQADLDGRLLGRPLPLDHRRPGHASTSARAARKASFSCGGADRDPQAIGQPRPRRGVAHQDRPVQQALPHLGAFAVLRPEQDEVGLRRPGRHRQPAQSRQEPVPLADDQAHPLLHFADEADRQPAGRLLQGVEVVRAGPPARGRRRPAPGRPGSPAGRPPSTRSWRRSGSPPAARRRRPGSAPTSRRTGRTPRRRRPARAPCRARPARSDGSSASPVGLLGEHRKVMARAIPDQHVAHHVADPGKSRTGAGPRPPRSPSGGRCASAGRRSARTPPPTGRGRRRPGTATAAPRWIRWRRRPARRRPRAGRPGPPAASLALAVGIAVPLQPAQLLAAGPRPSPAGAAAVTRWC